jgi:hypothetical protein
MVGEFRSSRSEVPDADPIPAGAAIPGRGPVDAGRPRLIRHIPFLHSMSRFCVQIRHVPFLRSVPFLRLRHFPFLRSVEENPDELVLMPARPGRLRVETPNR